MVADIQERTIHRLTPGEVTTICNEVYQSRGFNECQLLYNFLLAQQELRQAQCAAQDSEARRAAMKAKLQNVLHVPGGLSNLGKKDLYELARIVRDIVEEG